MLRRFLPALLLLAGVPLAAEFSSLNLGFDYRLRGTSVQNNDTQDSTRDTLSYYSQRARGYLTAWLNEDVEAALRVQSIGIWGLEGSTRPASRYPAADGSFWIEQAYVHLPNLWNKRLDLTLGRQPITLGDGMLVSDDELGFNALRAKVKITRAMDLDLFTAKIQENLSGHNDSDLLGAVFGLEQAENRWELGYVREGNSAGGDYRLETSTGSLLTTASRVERVFYDLRLFGNLKDAYYKLELAMQDGEARIDDRDVALSGLGQRLELGAQTDTTRYGRFGVKALYASGSGDDPGTEGEDEAFRPGFAKRWDGLEREGFGQHYAATLSDAYDPADPFSPTSSGLPSGASGIKTLGLGIFTVQKVVWTAGLDYFIYESVRKVAGQNSLGAELDAFATFRYTGYVSFGLGAALFFPGDLYGPNASRVTRYTADARVHF